MKKTWSSFLKFSFMICGLVLFLSCENTPTVDTVPYSKITGKTMGTTYAVVYEDSDSKNYKAAIDSLLEDINAQVSTYIPSATISVFNQGEALQLTIPKEAPTHFATNLITALEIYELSGGAFDPTVMPLVNYWGFGYTEKKAVTKIDSVKVSELQEYVGLDKVKFSVTEDKSFLVEKSNPKTQLDFSALAKGYGVDAVGQFLESKGIQNYLVEIGGETVCKGKSPSGELWRIGINTPDPEAKATDFQQIIAISNKGMATSGNYRNFFEVNGQKYAHTINPKTGYPEKSRLLSATVIAADCMRADALATACMVLGDEKALELAEKDPNIDIYLIVSDEEGNMQVKYSSGFKQYLIISTMRE